jgi:SNF2 family DNA or RNA helicase
MFTVDSYRWPAFGSRKPFAHQKATVAFLLKNKRAFVLNDMGTGKTLSAIWASDILLEAKKIRRVLVITPVSTMKAVWYTEIGLNTPHRKVSIAHGTRAQRLAALAAPTEFVVINHDGIKIIEDELLKEQFDVIIIDELTAYKSHSSERSKCMKRIADPAKAVWGMTGDLTPNSPIEAYYPCKIVNPGNKFLPKYFGQFRDACMTQINEMVWIPKEIAPQIVAMVTQPAVRFKRDDCLDLPDTTYQTFEIPLSKDQDTYYVEMRKQAMIDREAGLITAANSAVQLNKLLQISAGAVKRNDGTVLEIGCQPRLDMLFEVFDQTPQKKLVVFATYRATIEMLKKELTARKISVAAIHGDVSQNLRGQYIQDFQNGPLQVLILPAPVSGSRHYAYCGEYDRLVQPHSKQRALSTRKCPNRPSRPDQKNPHHPIHQHSSRKARGIDSGQKGQLLL